ncbi:MAG TPA: hypothetical protein DC054_08995 [Blastocatellia bacterium]|nr:hypothetical protein [Blastocatellia bacterium]
MKLLRAGSRRNSGYTQVFEKTPAVSWDNNSKEVVLRVGAIRDTSNKRSLYDYQIALNKEDLLRIVGSITN